jgi:hypothetical protein
MKSLWLLETGVLSNSNEILLSFHRFQLQFFTKEPLPFDHNNANLNVIEINPFKHLCHLQLNFMPGNDTDVKKYLANCLQTLKENYTRLCKEYAENKTSLTQRLETTQQVSLSPAHKYRLHLQL